jgi:hypothetical protein
VEQYKKGATDFNRYALIEQNLVTQQDLAAQARGEVSQGLIAVFRALGGGWEIRLGGGVAAPAPTAPEELPTPLPEENQPKTEEAPLPDAKS